MEPSKEKNDDKLKLIMAPVTEISFVAGFGQKKRKGETFASNLSVSGFFFFKIKVGAVFKI